MAITFPMSASGFQEEMGIASAAWNLEKFEEQSGYGSGEWLTRKLMPDLWEAEVSSVPMYHAQAHKIRSKLNVLGSVETFHLYNPAQPYPATDTSGAEINAVNSIVASGVWDDDGIWIDALPWDGPTVFTAAIASIDADRKTITLSRLPPDYVLTEGDLFSVIYSTSRVALIEVSETVTANGNGITGQFQVYPNLRAGIVVGLDANFVKPVAKCKIVSGTARVMPVDTVFSRITFRARQTLAAD